MRNRAGARSRRRRQLSISRGSRRTRVEGDVPGAAAGRLPSALVPIRVRQSGRIRWMVTGPDRRNDAHWKLGPVLGGGGHPVLNLFSFSSSIFYIYFQNNSVQWSRRLLAEGSPSLSDADK